MYREQSSPRGLLPRRPRCYSYQVPLGNSRETKLTCDIRGLGTEKGRSCLHVLRYPQKQSEKDRFHLRRSLHRPPHSDAIATSFSAHLCTFIEQGQECLPIRATADCCMFWKPSSTSERPNHLRLVGIEGKKATTSLEYKVLSRELGDH